MGLPKRPDFSEYESRIYQDWENKHVFTPKIDQAKKPYTILLPPPNANDPLHVGHAMYVVEDILCRFHRMLGEPTLFLPGTDHAGIETQFVFEKYLAKEGQSRFDFDRETLYQKISEFVEKNRGIATNQLRKLGFSLDWTRERYTLDSAILETVFETFRQLHTDNLIYREERLVNYCTHCGTGFSNLEVQYIERRDPLYYIKYGPFTLATIRPETKFGDTAVAVHPDDPRYQEWIDKSFIYESLIGPRQMLVVADAAVDPEFGTGAVKITPAHDHNDFEIARRHNLPAIKVIDRGGKLTTAAGRFAGLPVDEARRQVAAELEERGDLVKVDADYTHRVAVCYRCGHTIEPLLLPQWYVKTRPLTKPVVEAVNKGEVKLFPPRFKKQLHQWLTTSPDWNISRQIVWGPRIPVWYCLDCNPEIELTFLDKNGVAVTDNFADLKEKYEFDDIARGLQNLIAPINTTYQLVQARCKACRGRHLLQETDTFDTWFSSGQWPLSTLGYPDGEDFKYFYPTTLLDTMWDILAFWVMRMLMFGIYRTGQAPFKWAHMHARVVDTHGKKMSKSRGNVLDPMEVIDQYGADVLRMALVFGVAPAADVSLGNEKLVGMRNFVTKLWNVSRFVLAQDANLKSQISNLKSTPQNLELEKEDTEILKQLNATISAVTESLNQFRFAQASEVIYNFIWHEFADVYIEAVKPRLYGIDDHPPDITDQQQVVQILLTVLETSLKLLHPFAPFVTEEIYQKLPTKDAEFLAIAPWPEQLEIG